MDNSYKGIHFGVTGTQKNGLLKMSVASSMVQTIEIIFTKLTPNAYFINSKKLSPIVAKKAPKIGFNL